EQLNQAHADMVALEAAQAQRQVERVAQEALRERIVAEIAAAEANRALTTHTLDLMTVQVTESADREAQLMHELQATLLELARNGQNSSAWASWPQMARARPIRRSISTRCGEGSPCSSASCARSAVWPNPWSTSSASSAIATTSLPISRAICKRRWLSCSTPR